MSNTTQERQNQAIQSYILKAADRVSKNNAEKQVVTGTIISSSGTGSYTVKILSSQKEVNNVTSLTDFNFQKDDYVYLVTATTKTGDAYSTHYFIFGLVEEVREEFFNLTDWERFQVERDELIENLVNNGIYTTETEIITYSDNKNNNTYSSIIQAIKDYGHFTVKGTFSCENEEVNDYGIKLEFHDSETLLYTFDLTAPHFEGQPFNLIAVEQKRIGEYQDSFKDFNTIKVIAYIDSTDSNASFTVSNITLSAGILVDVGGSLAVSVKAENDKDYIIKRGDNEEADSTTLIAAATVNGKNLFNESIAYYWFVKDKTIGDDETSEFSKGEYKDEYEIRTTLSSIEKDKSWICINDYNMETFSDSSKQVPIWNCRNVNGFEANKIVLDKDEEVLTKDIFKYLTKYQNEIKCIVKYNNAVAQSKSFVVYNFNKEEFQVSISSGVDINNIYTEEDSITLTCNVNAINQYYPKFKAEYQWQKLEETEWINLDKCNGSKLKIKDSNKEEETIAAQEGSTDKVKEEWEMEKPEERYRCQVSLSAVDGNDNVSENIHIELSNEITIVSFVQEEFVLKPPELNRRYLESDYWNLTFSKKVLFTLAEDTNAVAGRTYYKKAESSDTEYETGVFIENENYEEGKFVAVAEFKENEVYYRKEEIYFENDIQYVQAEADPDKGKKSNKKYYNKKLIDREKEPLNSKQLYFIQVKDENRFIRVSYNNVKDSDSLYVFEKNFDENFPLTKNSDGKDVYNTVDYYERKDDTINTEGFKPNDNEPTLENSRNKTVYYTEQFITYIEKDNGKYKQAIRITDWSYPKILKATDNSGEEWSAATIGQMNVFNELFDGGGSQGMEVAEDGDVYINASMIRTGTLEVSDPDDGSNRKFRASIHEGKVEIGGYQVDETTLKSSDGKVGMSSGVQDTDIAFWAGNETPTSAPFNVDHAGKLVATEADIKGTIQAKELYIGEGLENIINANSNALEFNSNNLIINSDNLKYNSETLKVIGEIQATSGRIGDSNNYLELVTEENLLDHENFKVTKAGILLAKGATIEGALTVSKGSTIAGFTVNENSLVTSNLALTGIQGALLEDEAENFGYYFKLGEKIDLTGVTDEDFKRCFYPFQIYYVKETENNVENTKVCLYTNHILIGDQERYLTSFGGTPLNIKSNNMFYSFEDDSFKMNIFGKSGVQMGRLGVNQDGQFQIWGVSKDGKQTPRIVWDYNQAYANLTYFWALDGIKIPQIQFGSRTFTGIGKAETSDSGTFITSEAITFQFEFRSSPTVMVVSNTSLSGLYNHVECWATDVTISGFTINVKKRGSSSTETPVIWVAFGI